MFLPLIRSLWTSDWTIGVAPRLLGIGAWGGALSEKDSLKRSLLYSTCNAVSRAWLFTGREQQVIKKRERVHVNERRLYSISFSHSGCMWNREDYVYIYMYAHYYLLSECVCICVIRDLFLPVWLLYSIKTSIPVGVDSTSSHICNVSKQASKLDGTVREGDVWYCSTSMLSRSGFLDHKNLNILWTGSQCWFAFSDVS